MGRQAKLFIISRLLPGWFQDCGRGRFTILCDWCVLVPIQVFFFWQIHFEDLIRLEEFLKVIEILPCAKHVLHVYGNNLEKNEKTISTLWMGLVRHWRHSISREGSTDMVIVLVNVMVQNECGIFKVKYRSKETVVTIIWYFSIIISFIHQSW